MFQLILLNGSDDPGAAIATLVIFVILCVIALAIDSDVLKA